MCFQNIFLLDALIVIPKKPCQYLMKQRHLKEGEIYQNPVLK